MDERSCADIRCFAGALAADNAAEPSLFDLRRIRMSLVPADVLLQHFYTLSQMLLGRIWFVCSRVRHNAAQNDPWFVQGVFVRFAILWECEHIPGTSITATNRRGLMSHHNRSNKRVHFLFSFGDAVVLHCTVALLLQLHSSVVTVVSARR
jgi:hypothetical protein